MYWMLVDVKGKPHMFYSVPNARYGVDVMFFDCPKNLPMLELSSLRAKVVEWNKDVGDETL